MQKLILPALISAALGGCIGTGEVAYSSGGYASGGVYASTPDLVTVEPGVQVVADYDEPVFYTDGFYWRFYDGGWYRSNDYASGWIFIDAPPVRVRSISRPYAYAHYRPNGYVARDNRGRYRRAEPIVRDHRSAPAAGPGYRSEPVVRDHREAPPAASPGYRPAAAPSPVVRDHRSAPPAAAPARRERDRDTRDHRH